MELRIENVRTIPSAAFRLGRPVTVLVGESGSCKRTVLGCIEPLRGRAVSMLSNLGVPVVLATHADGVLEMVEDPVDAVRVCRREGGAATVSERDGEHLGQWSRAYGGVSQVSAAGVPAPRGRGRATRRARGTMTVEAARPPVRRGVALVTGR